MVSRQAGTCGVIPHFSLFSGVHQLWKLSASFLNNVLNDNVPSGSYLLGHMIIASINSSNALGLLNPLSGANRLMLRHIRGARGEAFLVLAAQEAGTLPSESPLIYFKAPYDGPTPELLVIFLMYFSLLDNG